MSVILFFLKNFILKYTNRFCQDSKCSRLESLNIDHFSLPLCFFIPLFLCLHPLLFLCKLGLCGKAKLGQEERGKQYQQRRHSKTVYWYTQNSGMNKSFRKEKWIFIIQHSSSMWKGEIWAGQTERNAI